MVKARTRARTEARVICTCIPSIPSAAKGGDLQPGLQSEMLSQNNSEKEGRRGREEGEEGR